MDTVKHSLVRCLGTDKTYAKIKINNQTDFVQNLIYFRVKKKKENEFKLEHNRPQIALGINIFTKSHLLSISQVQIFPFTPLLNVILYVQPKQALCVQLHQCVFNIKLHYL